MTLVKNLIAAGIVGAAAQAASAAALPGPLVTPQWLHDNAASVTVVDIRDDADSFSAAPKFTDDKKTGKKVLAEGGGHVPGALAVDFGSIRTARVENGVKVVAQLPSAADFTKVMDAAGLPKGDKPIVIVPTGDTVDSMDMATRLYFQLRYFGVPAGQVAILNGGVDAWLQAGYDVSTDKAAPSAGDWAASGEDKDLLASLDDVDTAVHNGGTQFIDARPTAQYLGIVAKPVVKSAGHLPGAHSFPTDAIVKTVGKATMFMTAADYKAIYGAYGIQTDTPTVTYCNTGHLASGAWFVSHELLGNAKARLYAGSMVEWTNMGKPTIGLPD
jgi:thiosulfate/3-mercaptopyruvate sulfurtransferase